MKTINLIVLLVLVSFAVPSIQAAQPADNPEFPGVQKAMTPEDYEAAGLQKLEAAERARAAWRRVSAIASWTLRRIWASKAR